MSFRLNKKLVVLVALDGWGIAPEGPGNAISLSQTPNFNRLWNNYPHGQLGASGESVGLPRGEDGNSETGHLNLGAGRIVYQYLARINMSIADGSFFENPVLIGAARHANENGSKLHIMGLVGSGGVHSSVEHLYALIKLAAMQKVKKVYVHAFTDGRDSPPNISETYIKQITNVMNKEGVGQIASVTGRYWAMDRDRRWERTAKAYFALTKGEGGMFKYPEEAIEQSYALGATDEFIEPSLIVDEYNKPIALVEENDAVIFYNFRIDRPRQLVRAFVMPDAGSVGQEWGFDPYMDKYGLKQTKGLKPDTPMFKRGERVKNLYFGIMTEYEKPVVEAGAKAAFTPEIVEMPIGRVISEANLRQIRIAESEKERFVTYYFNGRREENFSGEDRLIVESPKVPTYDLKPEMSSYEITQKVLKSLDNENYSFAFINYASPDMVGHTGNIAAAKRAVEAVDECLGKLANQVLNVGGALVITADHGNVEEMINQQTGEIDTEHSVNTVPLIIVSSQLISKNINLGLGILADVGPTVLGLLGLQIPSQMNGRNLLKGISF